MQEVARRALPVPPSLRELAEALEAEPAVSARCSRDLELRTLACAQGVAPALLIRSSRDGTGPALPEEWRIEARHAGARHLVLQESLARIARLFGVEGIAFAPIKGGDVAYRFYADPAERPVADLDLLISAEDLPRARRCLLADGWRAQNHGSLELAFLESHGYCWQAWGANGVLVELHYRLWGMAPEAMAPELLERAAADPDLGRTGRRLRSEDAWLVAALHLWQQSPRRLMAYWDLERIAAGRGDDFSRNVVAAARRWDLALPALLAARVAGTLWRAPAHRAIAKELAQQLRWSEKLVVRRCLRHGEQHVSLGLLTLSRLLAGRRSRTGWLAPLRRLWPHAGLVARASGKPRPGLRDRWSYARARFRRGPATGEDTSGASLRGPRLESSTLENPS